MVGELCAASGRVGKAITPASAAAPSRRVPRSGARHLGVMGISRAEDVQRCAARPYASWQEPALTPSAWVPLLISI